MRTPTQLRAAAMPLRDQRADDRAQPQEEEIVVFEPLSRRSLAALRKEEFEELTVLPSIR